MTFFSGSCRSFYWAATESIECLSCDDGLHRAFWLMDLPICFLPCPHMITPADSVTQDPLGHDAVHPLAHSHRPPSAGKDEASTSPTSRLHAQVGKRKTQVTILGGSVVRVWGALEGMLQRHEHSLSRSDRTMRAVHVSFPDGSLPLIGVCLRLSLCLDCMLKSGRTRRCRLYAEQRPPAMCCICPASRTSPGSGAWGAADWSSSCTPCAGVKLQTPPARVLCPKLPSC